MTKPFKTYSEQVDLLENRGMGISNRDYTIEMLRTHNYYRLAGYWHSMRELDPTTLESVDRFRKGATFDLVMSLYNYDARVRNVLFAELSSIELSLRALIGHELGRLDPLIHLKENLLAATARKTLGNGTGKTAYSAWREKYESTVSHSREDFILHYKGKYDCVLPVWVAVEIMDWGMLSYLYRFSPLIARESVASDCGMTAPQLESWLKALNILRNYTAHHARVFTRVFDIKPKRIDNAQMRVIHERTNSLFGQVSMIRFLQKQLGIEYGETLAGMLRDYPHNDLVPFRRTGTPENWEELDLWR